MADYYTLNEALTADVENMTVLRNNVRNDDSTVTYSTGIDWFKFNNVVVSNIYSSGNSWLGFGVSSEQLRINRRDCAVYYEYSETGRIHGYRFYKFTWAGYSYYNSTGSQYYQSWDVFLFENGQIFLNFKNIPASNLSGTFQLVCGTTLNYHTPTTESYQYTFTPSDKDAGTYWTVEDGQPELPQFYSYGEAEFEFEEISSLSRVLNSKIEWFGYEPEGTLIQVYAKINNNEYQECTNNSYLPINWPNNLNNSILYIKIVLNTDENKIKTPTLYNLYLQIYDQYSYKNIVLIFNRGSQNSFQNAIGTINVEYSGAGYLLGYSGPVSDFSENFIPVGLEQKQNPSEQEHVNISSVNISGDLLLINYIKSYEEEHVEISSFIATSSLIYVEDN